MRPEPSSCEALAPMLAASCMADCAGGHLAVVETLWGELSCEPAFADALAASASAGDEATASGAEPVARMFALIGVAILTAV